MKGKKEIPKKDLKLINDSFAKDAPADTIKKDPLGEKLSQPSKETVNQKGYVFNDFRGRVLKHNKSLIPKGGTQIMIGQKGQSYDDIPLEQRKRIMWTESDFE